MRPPAAPEIAHRSSTPEDEWIGRLWRSLELLTGNRLVAMEVVRDTLAEVKDRQASDSGEVAEILAYQLAMRRVGALQSMDLATGGGTSERLRRCLLALPHELREVVVLHDVDASPRTTAEVAAILGLTEGVVIERIERARALLRQLLSRGGGR